MKQKRQNVFETNSSSTHSISIATETNGVLMDTIAVNSEGIVEIECGEFGWEIETFNYVTDRLAYAATYAKNYASDEEMEMFKDVIRNQTGANDITFINVSNYGSHQDFGYIDHQSIDVVQEAFTDKETLRQFIFNPNSWFKTDNDN